MTEPAGVASLFTTAPMAAVFSPEARVAKLLAFEAALARAEGDLGVIPAAEAQAIAACCEGGGFSHESLYREALVTGTVVVPLVRAIGDRVGGDASRWVHWGATSQDALDTAAALQMREGLLLLEADLVSLGDACLEHATRHRLTVMAGRTLLQQAVPITFGLKAARWLALVTRRLAALRTCRRESLALQFGGAAGTLAALEAKGWAVAERLAELLELPLPDLPWHAERDRVATVAAAVGIAAGSAAKIAGDIVLLAQTEVAEVAPGGGGDAGRSSAMPQKRNPVDATLAIAAARLAQGAVSVVLAGMAQEHERGAGAWQAEWEAVPDAFRHAAGAIAAVQRAVAGMRPDPIRMRANLDAAGGAVMSESLASALAAHIGRPDAQRLVAQLVAHLALGLQDRGTTSYRRGTTLHEVATADPRVTSVLDPAALARALGPVHYLGVAERLIDRAIDGYRRVRAAE